MSNTATAAEILEQQLTKLSNEELIATKTEIENQIQQREAMVERVGIVYRQNINVERLDNRRYRTRLLIRNLPSNMNVESLRIIIQLAGYDDYELDDFGRDRVTITNEELERLTSNENGDKVIINFPKEEDTITWQKLIEKKNKNHSITESK